LSKPQITTEEATNRGTDQNENLYPLCVGVFSRSYRVNPDRHAQERGERSVQQFVDELVELR